MDYRFAKGFLEFYNLVKLFTVQNGLELGQHLPKEWVKKKNKYENTYEGPSAITKLWTNGTVTICQRAAQELINIRCIFKTISRIIIK